ncbi:hypothetical protein ACHAXR_003805 [Thalassiosira sp. AJA248-18]
MLSYEQAIIKCRSMSSGKTLADKVSVLTIDDLNEAAQMLDNGRRATGTAGEFLRAVKTSCRPIGYSAEAAAFHRRNHFAFDDFFGNSAIFLTTTPCDECTLRLRLIVHPEKSHGLPHLGDPMNDETQNACILDLTLRKKDRLMLPGGVFPCISAPDANCC